MFATNSVCARRRSCPPRRERCSAARNQNASRPALHCPAQRRPGPPLARHHSLLVDIALCGAEPARVVTKPAGVILRIALLNSSPTYTLPAGSTATPSGLSNDAALPVPSALPSAPDPASVVTTPAGVILRISLLP